MPDLLSGQVQFIIATYLNVGQHAKAGKLRLLATTLPERSPLMPDVPSIIEAGQAKFPIGPWAAILGPAKLPAEIIQRLNTESAKAMAKPEVREALMQQGFAPSTNSVVEFTAYLKGQVEAWRSALKDAGVEPQ
jgi:tripartite-type tricarboxylate transporter receptor subunit TctC